jgi:putative ABC transport system permease protein
MGGLTGYGLRSLWARPLRSLLSLVGIALGVAVLFASLATSAGIEAAIDRTVADVGGTADLRVAAFQEVGLGPDSVAAIEDTPGVAVAAPGIERRTFLGPEQFGAGEELPEPVTILAIDPEREPAVRTLALAGGRLLTGTDELGLLITERLAAADGLRLGSQIVLQGSAENVPLRGEVVGILAGDGPLLDAAGRTVVLPERVALALFGVEGVTRVDLALEEGATVEGVTAAIQERLVGEPYVITTADDVATSLRASTADFQGMTALIAAVSLFAGAFLIFNTLSMTVAERFREVGLLRAAGATRGQLTRAILVQGAVLGLIGSLAGVVLGAVLAQVMASSIGRVGSVELERPAMSLAAVAGGLLAGSAVTLAAAFEPARRAGRISPVEALRPRVQDAGGRGAQLRWVVAVFAIVAGLGLVAWPPAGGTPALVRAVAVYTLLLSVILALPFLLPGLGRIAGAPFALVLRIEERLARASLVRDPSRAALTVGALTVALAMLVALAGMGDQVRRTAGAWLEEVVPGEVLLTSIRPVPLDEGLGELVAGFGGVARVSPIATFELAVDGTRVDGAAVVGADLAADGRLRFVAGDRASALAAIDAGGATILPERAAEHLGATVGTTLAALDGDGGTTDLLVVGIVERTLPGRTGESMLVGWPDATVAFGIAGADAFAVRFEPGATVAQRAQLETDARSLALTPAPIGEIGTAIGRALGRVFGLFDALALVAVIVAALGIVNTLSMNVLERVREIGVLRAAGMTRRQVWRTVIVEAGICGLAGALLGSLTGVVAGALMVGLAGGRPDPATLVPWPAVGLALVLGVGLAMLAAAWPARVASGLPIVRAVRHE